MNQKTYILFVCKDNSLYSQMAEAMVRLYRDDEICAFSAGIHPAGRVNPRATELMERIGYHDMVLHTTKSTENVPEFNYDYVITIGAPTYIFAVSAERRLEW